MGMIRSYYQQWYAEHTPPSYTGNPFWERHIAALRGVLAALDTPRPRALEVGSGGGNLQHLVEDYTGIDLASSAGRFLEQPFCAASATGLPFANGVFDIVWSIWTLEHVIDPQRMLAEMVRVTRTGGYMFLCAAWCVPDWATRGYHLGRARTFAERVLGASVVPRRVLGWPSIIASRLAALVRPERGNLDYRFLLPNLLSYDEYDADACIHIDSAAVIRWMTRQGVTCVSHPTWWHVLRAGHGEPLIFRVAKPHD